MLAYPDKSLFYYGESCNKVFGESAIVPYCKSSDEISANIDLKRVNSQNTVNNNERYLNMNLNCKFVIKALMFTRNLLLQELGKGKPKVLGLTGKKFLGTSQSLYLLW